MDYGHGAHATQYNASVQQAIKLRTEWAEDEVRNFVGDTVDLFRDGLTPDQAAEAIMAAAQEDL